MGISPPGAYETLFPLTTPITSVNPRVGKPFPEDSRTGTFCRFAENPAEGKRLYDRYLAQNNIQAKSLDGYPRDDTGQRELVTEAINAIMVLAKTDEPVSKGEFIYKLKASMDTLETMPANASSLLRQLMP